MYDLLNNFLTRIREKNCFHTNINIRIILQNCINTNIKIIILLFVFEYM